LLVIIEILTLFMTWKRCPIVLETEQQLAKTPRYVSKSF